ncbi:hypothetical protein RHMOL_Rhmol05G0260100 [Rhododendron molle]|uniref:Uncharacterized protein n=2 Tax=Rhododendron molle TaxID=49168 RepID=A0ACC0NVB9_RHOML|nr:hypothetical protein RHMOL_Rhmol05G0260100 [Rhododendron molle]
MDKLSPTVWFLLVVLLYASDTVKIKLMVGADTCFQGLGRCVDAHECDRNCKSLHPHVPSKGICTSFRYKPKNIFCECSYACK